uniref:C2H2-type domain-containing protein n=1 Tax=Meloidogyne hapla TaxID=6305 RepID=A0A1I8BQC9_MELHA
MKICQICSTQGFENINFEDGKQLREHLIEASVDYSTQDSNGIHVNEQNSESFNVENTKTKDHQNEANTAGGDALMLLKGFLESVAENGDGQKQFCEKEVKEEVNEVEEEVKQEELPSTSNILASGEEEQQPMDELDFFAPLKSLLLSSTLDSAQGSGNSTPSRAAIVDSKAIRKAHCQVCNLDICSTARQRHVYMVHLKKKDLFKCRLCEYTNSNSLWEVQKHTRMQHSSDIRPISQEEKHKLEIQMWGHLCFPEWKQKPQKRKYQPEEEQNEEKEEKDVKEEVIEEDKQIFQKIKKSKEKLEEIEEEKEEDDGGRASTTTLTTSTGGEAEGSSNDVNDRLCHICMEESKYPGRHIAQRHLNQPLYECPVCFKFGSYESCTVVKHIKKVHPEAPSDTSPISNLEKYADQIRDLQARCFPNRQMKLVRPLSAIGKSRPRERHHCGMCGADVAQSDRQRHVYHKHLRKGKIFECPLCDFSSNYDIHRVKWHIKWDHKDFVSNGNGSPLEPISHEARFRDEIDATNEKCFPGWQRKRHISSPESEDSPNKEEKIEGGGTDLELMQKAIKTMAEVFQQQNRQEGGNLLPESSNALDWTCRLCWVALRPGTNLLRHVAKDHLNLPLYQCPICENHGAHSAYEVRSHMLRSHGADASQEPLSSLEENIEEIENIWKQCFPHKDFKAGGGEKALMVIENDKFLDEAKVRCKECWQEMKTEDRQIHVYRHHLREPRLYECPLCDFSHYACSSDVRNHILRAHKDQSEVMPKANLLQFSKEIAEWNERCFPGWINRRLPASLIEDFNSCRLCGMDVRQTSRHIAEHHLHIPLHQCPLCEYGAAEARLVQRHMRNNHTLTECEGLEPIANVEKRRSEFSELHNQCFPGRPKRLSNITIADESRRAKCRGCGMTISKKRRLIHLLEKHLKKPIYKCKYCLFSSTHERLAVEAHQKEKHSKQQINIISNLNKHKNEMKRLAEECFNEFNLKLED